MLKKFITAGQGAAEFEATEQDVTATLKALSSRPLTEILAEITQTKDKNGRIIDTALAEVERRHAPVAQAKEAAYRAAMSQVALEENELKADINAGRYSSQPAHEATILELKQKAIEAESELIAVKEEHEGAKAVFLRPVVNGSRGSGASVAGVDWPMFVNLVKALLSEFEQTAGPDFAQRFMEEYQRANDAAVSYHNAQAEIKGKLAQFKEAARARYGGSLAPTQGQAPAPAQTAFNNQHQPANQTPARRPGDWGEVSLTASLPPQYMPLKGR